MTVEDFFKKSDYQKQITNKRDEKFHLFSMIDMVEFAEQYHEAKMEKPKQAFGNQNIGLARKAVSYQRGNRFMLPDDPKKVTYVFSHITFIDGTKIFCSTVNGDKKILTDYNLLDLIPLP